MSDYAKLDHPEILSYIFRPRRYDRPAPPPGSSDVDLMVAKDVLIGCRFYRASTTAPTLLFFHGNAETVGDYDKIASKYKEFGINLMMATYRGYGWSTGQPSVGTMLEDAETILQETLVWLAQRGFDGPLCVMGRSLGSASAIDLVARHQDLIKALIIESGFGDTLPLARSLGIDTENSDITEADCFRNCEKIEEIKIPTLILHGAADTLILPRLAEKLQACSGARAKQFLLIPGAAHSTMIATGGDTYFSTIKAFIDKACGVTHWTYKKRRRGQNTDA
ncbi:MAG: alpha/beta hydrolase [Desulfopila sp.]